MDRLSKKVVQQEPRVIGGCEIANEVCFKLPALYHGDNKLSIKPTTITPQVHERTVDSDFLIIILRDLALQRKDLTLVLMSATLNADVSALALIFYFSRRTLIVLAFRSVPAG